MRVLDHFVVTGTNHFACRNRVFSDGELRLFLHAASGVIGPGVQTRCRQTSSVQTRGDIGPHWLGGDVAPTESIESWRARYRMARGMQGAHASMSGWHRRKVAS